MFKSAEEKEAERREREAERAAEAAREAEAARQEEEARKHAAWLASPVGAATAAKEAGEAFLELQLQVGGHVGQASWGMASGERSVISSAGVLASIEDVGWRLEHASYFFMPTAESTSEGPFSGQQTAISGVTVGVYLFRRAD